MPEVDYLKMCNATKYVHDNMTSSYECPEYYDEEYYGYSYESDYTEVPMVRNPFWRNGPDFGMSYVPSYKDITFTPSRDNIEITNLEWDNKRLTAEIRILTSITLKPKRVLNEDRYNALMSVFSVNHYNYNVDPTMNTMTKKISELKRRLTIEYGVDKDLADLYREEMNARVNHNKEYSDKMIEKHIVQIDRNTKRIAELRD
jgi:hypothetical protein